MHEMNDIETPLLECHNRIESDNETIKYTLKVCIYLLLFCIFFLFIMVLLEVIHGNNEYIHIVSKISIGTSMVVSSILVLIIIIYFIELNYI